MDSAETTMDLVCRYLEAEGFNFRVVDDGQVIDTGIEGRSAVLPIRITLVEQGPTLNVLVRLSFIVPEDQRPAMAEAVARANQGLILGCFELDMSDGTMAFRAGMPLAEGSISHEQFRDLLYPAALSADRYHRGFCRLLYGDDLSPAEAIAEVEMAE